MEPSRSRRVKGLTLPTVAISRPGNLHDIADLGNQAWQRCAEGDTTGIVSSHPDGRAEDPRKESAPTIVDGPGRGRSGVSVGGNQKTMECTKARSKLTLLGGFQLSVGDSFSVPLGAQRLLAMLALEEGEVDRARATERLWPDSCRSRAAANLRSALWRGKRAGDTTLIDCAGPRLRLASPIRVDLHELLRRVRQIVGPSPYTVGIPGHQEIINGLSRELLPTWSDHWLLPERDRWDQVRLHALETLAQHFMKSEDYLTALEAAFTAISIEPIRESAHRVVLKIHIAEGNSASALKHYQRYRGLLQRELGISPSRQMDELIQPLTPTWRSRDFR